MTNLAGFNGLKNLMTFSLDFIFKDFYIGDTKETAKVEIYIFYYECQNFENLNLRE